MTYLVDSDYVADYLKGQRNAIALLDRLLPAGLGISIITFAEIYEGIYYGQQRQRHEQGFRQFLRGATVLGIPRSVACQFAIIRGELRAKDTAKHLVHPKDKYDLLIAATALHYRLTLVTRNISDYDRIPGLTLYQES